MPPKKKAPSQEVSVSPSSVSSSLEVTPSSLQLIQEACKRQNLSLDNYVKAIKDALSATKVTLDKFGDEHVEEDHDKRLKAALMGLELEGYIRSKQVAVDNSKHTHVTYAWLNSPTTIKAEAPPTTIIEHDRR